MPFIYDFMKAKIQGGEDYDLHKSLGREIRFLINEETPETEEGKTIYNLLNSPRKLRQFLEELAQRHQELAYRFRHVPLFSNPDEPYNFNMQNSNPFLRALENINETLSQMNQKLEKLDKLDKLDEIAENTKEIKDNTEEIKKNTSLIYHVALTTKAEISEKSLLGAFLIHLRELGYKGARVIDTDLYQEGKEDYVIRAEVIAENGSSHEEVFSLEITNYLDKGHVLERKIKNLLKRAEKRKSIPVLAARYMSEEAKKFALGKGVKVFTYDPNQRRMRLWG